MKKIFVVIPALAAALAVISCTTAEDVREDAKATPIGSVISGETTSTDSYLKRVERENKKLDKDTWRPQGSERF